MTRPFTRYATALCAIGALTGCPAFMIDRGPIASPTRSLARPSVLSLPGADAYATLADKWRREARIGIGGACVATLLDPGLVAAMVSHDAAVEGLDRDAESELLRTRWATLFGTDLDRFAIDVEWRFDEQFVTHAEVLDPETWTFTLTSEGLGTYKPLETAVLERGKVPVEHYFEGKVRLWFPWRDLAKGELVLGGGVPAVTLSLQRETAKGALTWRFRGAY